jgi:hypothetical protein
VDRLDAPSFFRYLPIVARRNEIVVTSITRRCTKRETLFVPMPPAIYDVCLIGSGTARAIVNKTLCERGGGVILPEGGEEVNPARFCSRCCPYDLENGGFRESRNSFIRAAFALRSATKTPMA